MDYNNLQKSFTDYIETGIENLSQVPDLENYPTQNYKLMILKSLQGKYDDLEDYESILQALNQISENIITRNIIQLKS